MAEVPKQFTQLEFGCYTDDDARKLSVLEITNSKTFDTLGHVTANGLYDRKLGPHDRTEICGTCSLTDAKCSGHMGHIELPMPVYNPMWMSQLELLVRGSCFSCKKILEDNVWSEQIICTVRLIDAGLWDKIDGLLEIYCELDSVGATQIMVQMNEYVNKVIAEHTPVEVSKSSRYAIFTRKDLIDKYKSVAFKNQKGHCAHCLVPIRKLKIENHVRFLFNEGASKQGIARAKRALTARQKSKLKAKRAKAKKSASEDEGFEDTMDVDEEEDDKELVHMMEDSSAEDIDVKELEDKMVASQRRVLLTPSVLREHMRAVWDKNSNVLKAVCAMLQVPIQDFDELKDDRRPTDIFFLSVIPVPPTKFRPVAKRYGVLHENPSNIIYIKVMESANQIRLALQMLTAKNLDPDALVDSDSKKQQAYDTLHRSMVAMQLAVNNILDHDMSRLDTSARPPGVRQLIEKKAGLFRKHMMGKRVDFAARSVISPDPFIGVDEIGIPEVFAKRLTFPESVNVHNVDRLRKAVINGPNTHPGATHVVNEKGMMTLLSATNQTQREALARTLLTVESDSLNAKPKTVCRHLKNGDMLLMNRQPTLHRPSIQAHKAHVLPGEKTIRLHYANCNAYNADFDGDEMNAHFPQTFVGQSEAREIVATRNQYLVPKNGAPLAGLIQDHVIGGVTLCMRGRFFTREEYQQLVFSGLVDQQTRVKLLPPAVIKPVQLWTGKQVISSVLRNLLPGDNEEHYITLTGRSKIGEKSWMNSPATGASVPLMGEETVVFRQGHLVQGVLDKNHYGASMNGLVHSCYELYGGKVSSQLLTSLARLFTTFLKSRGFTIGVQDILCLPQADEKREDIMESGSQQACGAVAEALGVEQEDEEYDSKTLTHTYMAAQFDDDDTRMKLIDLHMKQISDSIQNDITKAIMPQGLLKKFPDNNLQLMVVAGAKGSTVNCMQISCLLGQIELEGRRPQLTMSGRSLPSFRPYDMSPRAGGFVDGRFLSGIKPQEYFFHCMAGREGLVDTAVKTSRSGYLQRCLIKHLEGIMVEYDSTVRDSDGSIVQFQYGDDGLSVMKTNMLSTKQFPFLIANQKTAANQNEVSKLRQSLDKKKARRWDKKIANYKEMWAEFSSSERRSAFLKYCEDQPDSVKSATEKVNGKLCRPATSNDIETAYRGLTEEERVSYDLYSQKCPEPTLSKYLPSKYLHSMSEKLREELELYKLSNPHQLLSDGETDVPYGKISVEQLEELISLYSCRSQVEPGDGVGILAAQSIGEPSTQMTLNTFHFAGRGDMNVTLGIPRLREILLVASKTPKTSFMDIPFRSSKHARKRARNLQLRLNAVKLSEVLERADISTQLVTVGVNSDLGTKYTVRLQFLPAEQYTSKCLLTPKFIMSYVERTFVPAITKAYMKLARINRDLKIIDALAWRREPASAAAAKADDMEVAEPEQDADDMDEMMREVGDDADAVADKEFRSMNEEREYDEEDEMAEVLGGGEGESEPEDGESLASSAESESHSDAENPTIDSLSTRKRLKLSRKADSNCEMNPERVANVTSIPNIIKYEYDAEEELWCEITFKYDLGSSAIDMTPIVQSVASSSLVCDPEKFVHGVSKAILSEPKHSEDILRLKTVGVNIQRMFQYNKILDLNKLYSNDIHAMADNYGIEAAYNVLIKEIRDVFAAYGITVNYRHLSLLADYMTCDGKYKPFNQTGLRSHSSALQKMTYEASTKFLKETMMAGGKDDLNSPSARIVVGRPVKVGTGSFECVTKFQG